MIRYAALILALLCAAPPLAAETLWRDDAGRDVPIPDHPARVVSLDDLVLTVPLLELGIVPIASQGRVSPSGDYFLRSGLGLTGLDFDNTGMAFLGMQPVDVEAVAGLGPDLILTLDGRPTPPDQLARIAPTVVLDDTRHSPRDFYRLLARITGRTERLDLLERRDAARIAQLRHVLGDAPPSVSVFDATGDGKLSVEHTYGALGAVLRDAGLAFPAMTNAIPPNKSVTVSPELLPELDADFIFGTYRDDKDETPEDARARLAAIVPDYCRYLRACREGRMYFVPRDPAKSLTYAARAMAIAFVTGVISATPAREPAR